jgi:hypothetical protein
MVSTRCFTEGLIYSQIYYPTDIVTTVKSHRIGWDQIKLGIMIFYTKLCEVLQNIVLFVSGVKLPVLLEIYNGIFKISCSGLDKCIDTVHYQDKALHIMSE